MNESKYHHILWHSSPSIVLANPHLKKPKHTIFNCIKPFQSGDSTVHSTPIKLRTEIRVEIKSQRRIVYLRVLSYAHVIRRSFYPKCMHVGRLKPKIPRYTHTHKRTIIHIFVWWCCCCCRHRCGSFGRVFPLLLLLLSALAWIAACHVYTFSCAHFLLLVRCKRFTLFLVCSFVPTFVQNPPNIHNTVSPIRTAIAFNPYSLSLSLAPFCYSRLRLLLHSTSIVRFGKSAPFVRSAYF